MLPYISLLMVVGCTPIKGTQLPEESFWKSVVRISNVDLSSRTEVEAVLRSTLLPDESAEHRYVFIGRPLPQAYRSKSVKLSPFIEATYVSDQSGGTLTLWLDARSCYSDPYTKKHTYMEGPLPLEFFQASERRGVLEAVPYLINKRRVLFGLKKSAHDSECVEFVEISQ